MRLETSEMAGAPVPRRSRELPTMNRSSVGLEPARPTEEFAMPECHRRRYDATRCEAG